MTIKQMVLNQIVFIQADGSEKIIHGHADNNLMELALEQGVQGIDGDCGGNCICATCHVFVDEQWISRVGKPSADEESLLALNPERNNFSRLCCQIKASDALNGLVVKVPQYQY